MDSLIVAKGLMFTFHVQKYPYACSNSLKQQILYISESTIVINSVAFYVGAALAAKGIQIIVEATPTSNFHTSLSVVRQTRCFPDR